jgi:bifunctional non-homologous end joining protein LigD
MPTAIYPMLASSADEAFDNPDWLFEIKLDGYRAIAFVENGRARLVSRNQNDLTAQFPELADLAKHIQAKTAILDGEIVALDDQGRPSFSLIQQRTGLRSYGRRVAPKADIPILYYAFDLLYLDGEDLRRTPLDERKARLSALLKKQDGAIRLSDHFNEHGLALLEAARKAGLEGIVAKRRSSLYEERRSHDWLKIKLRHQIECVIGGYTDPEGSRAHFGSIVLGLYDKQDRLIHVGQAGSGFDHKTLEAVWKRLEKIKSSTSPFFGKVEALRRAHWVQPKMVAQIEFGEWTHSTDEGGPKLRAPVFLGLRDDKDPRECRMDQETASKEKL